MALFSYLLSLTGINAKILYLRRLKVLFSGFLCFSDTFHCGSFVAPLLNSSGVKFQDNLPWCWCFFHMFSWVIRMPFTFGNRFFDLKNFTVWFNNFLTLNFLLNLSDIYIFQTFNLLNQSLFANLFSEFTLLTFLVITSCFCLIDV